MAAPTQTSSSTQARRTTTSSLSRSVSPSLSSNTARQSQRLSVRHHRHMNPRGFLLSRHGRNGRLQVKFVMALGSILCIAMLWWRPEQDQQSILLWSQQDQRQQYHSYLQERQKSTSQTKPLGMMKIHSQQPQNETVASAAACLLIKDDNHWLIEWLAYHYHVLPLRQLVIVRDPRSRTSPDKILDRWRTRMEITEWTDSVFVRKWILKSYAAGNMTEARMHRYRQQFLYTHCLRHFQTTTNVSWVLFSDTDEFVRPNPHVLPHSTRPITLKEPGSVMKTLDLHIQRAEKGMERNTQGTLPLSENATVPLCLHIPRLQLSTQTTTDRRNDGPTPSTTLLNRSHLLTTTWFYHSGQEITTGHNLDGKNMIDVRRLPPEDIPARAENVHFLIPKYCPAKEEGSHEERLLHPLSWLLIYHYPGTLEQYMFREDPRDAIPGRPKRNIQMWEALGRPKQPVANGSMEEIWIRDDSMSDWLEGFIEEVGTEETVRLLEGVGQVGFE